jgi:hypothetical protein
MGLEGALSLARELVGICDFGDATHQDLRAQSEGGFDVVVDQLLKGKATKLTRQPCHSTNRITRGVGFGQGSQQLRVLLGRGIQLHLCDELHTR